MDMRLLRCSALIASLLVLPTAALAAECSDKSARPEVGKPLQAAAAAVSARNGKAAAAELKKAEAVGNRCPYEDFIIEQMRAAVATASGDNAGAMRSHEALLASGRLSSSEQLRSLQSLSALSYQNKEYAKSIAWTNKYYQAGGTDNSLKAIQAQSYYLSNDCPNAIKTQNELINADVKNGNRPAESGLQLVAACASQMKDGVGLLKAREQLVNFYPKKEYWVDLIKAVSNRPGFSDRLALDVSRLEIALGTLNSDSRYMEAAQYAMIAGSSGEARQVVDRGFATKVLGNGQQGERHNRLRKMVMETVAKEEPALDQRVTEAQANLKNGDAIASAAYAYVGYGQPAKAIPLLEQAIAKAEFKHKDDAKLDLALAYIAVGQQSKAAALLPTITGTDGTGDLARLWTMVLKQNPKAGLVAQ
jgi:hypothetical protein